ncbi:MAG: BON domain-containing protein [bacterium]
MKSNKFILMAVTGVLVVSMIGCANTRKVTMTDQQIADQIEAQLEAPTGPEGPFTIDIFVNKGNVTLDGTVPTATAKEQAMDVAHSTAGVKDVKSFLSVR